MNRQDNFKSSKISQPNETDKNSEKVREVRDVQERLAFAAGLFQGDVTVRTLIESLAEGLVVIDHESQVILINKRAEEIFGYARQEVVGQTLDLLLPKRYSDTHANHVREFFDKPHVRNMGQGLELTAKHKNNTEFPVEIGLSFLDTEAGRFGLAYITDITLRKQVEQALKERNEALDAFAHTVAHELNDALTSLMGMSSYLSEDYTAITKKELGKYLKDIAQSSRKMSIIVSELLRLASIRKKEVTAVPLDMKAILGETMNRLKEMIKENKAEITYPDNFHAALGHAPWVEEVWYNYICNAIKYGGEPPRVEIGCKVYKNDYIQFWVKDNGKGFSNDMKKEIFSQNRYLGQHHLHGHGFGLSIVKQIVEKLNGHVDAQSEIGKGSVFSFCLPKVKKSK